MTMTSFVMFISIIYLMIMVSRTVWENYQSNKNILHEQEKLLELEDELSYMENQIVYLKTNSYREKQARAKLGYIAPGETAVSLPPDKVEDRVSDSHAITEKNTQSIANYYLWYKYFFDSQ